MDIPKASGAGVGEGMQATGRQLGHNAAIDPASLNALGELLNDAGKSVGDDFTEHLSEGGKAVNQMPITEAAKMFGQAVPVLAGSAVAGPAGAIGYLQNAGMTHACATRQTQKAINQLNDDQLMQNPTFVKLFNNIDQSPQYHNYSDLKKIDLAKAQLAERRQWAC